MSKLYVQLGRIGDIMGILPLLWKDAQSGVKPRLMVAAEFAGVLDGVSYVEPVIFDGPHYEVARAVALAETTSNEVICTQVNTKDAQTETYLASIATSKTPTELIIHKDAMAAQRGATSFQKESWRVAGRLGEWDECLPLVFDRRDADREAKLLRDAGLVRRGAKKPLILLALGGTSSPFPYADLLRELVKGRFGEEYQIMELPQAGRIYDLLALYEKASLLIATDSAPLHLAWACRDFPVFALTQDKPSLWHGSPWKPNHRWYCRYGDWVNRAVEMLGVMEAAFRCSNSGNFLWVSSAYEKNDVNAEMSGFWSNYLKVTVGICGRDSQSVLQDTKRVPYFRDVIRMAMQKAENDATVIYITRPQIYHFRPLPYPPFYAYRIQDGKYRPVVDLFAATKAQWKEMLADIPDLLMSGDYEWSQALWVIFKARGASDATGCCRFVPDAVQTPKVAGESKTLLHNRKLCAEVMVKSKVHSRYPKVSEQLEVFPTDLRHCFPFGYNPSIRKHGDGMQMVYRYHQGKASTSLALADMDALGRVTRNVVLLDIPNRSCDDPKFFEHGGETFVSWVESEYPNNLKAVVKYAWLADDRLMNVQQPSLPGNDGSTTQKNWVFFERNNELNCIHQCHPKHIVYAHNLNLGIETNAPVWPYGEIRGGTPPVEYAGKLLRFFHSRINNEFGPVTWRYFVGAYVMNPEPPFDVVAVSCRPILYGSEVDGLTSDQRKACIHRKTNVVFPNGVIAANGCWLLSVGVNDCESLILKVRPENLNL